MCTKYDEWDFIIIPANMGNFRSYEVMGNMETIVNIGKVDTDCVKETHNTIDNEIILNDYCIFVLNLKEIMKREM